PHRGEHREMSGLRYWGDADRREAREPDAQARSTSATRTRRYWIPATIQSGGYEEEGQSLIIVSKRSGPSAASMVAIPSRWNLWKSSSSLQRSSQSPSQTSARWWAWCNSTRSRRSRAWAWRRQPAGVGWGRSLQILSRQVGHLTVRLLAKVLD